MKIRIKEILKEKGISQAQLAEMMGVHTVTISKKLSKEKEEKLDIEWIQKFSKALNISEQNLLFGETSTRTVTVKSFVQAGKWQEDPHWTPEDFYDIAVPDDAALRPYSLYAAEARGPSMNRRYPEGTVLIFTSAIETMEDVELGRRYIVERESTDGLREATVKTLHKDENGKHWLIPESTDPLHQQPIELDGHEGVTIRIVGRVRYAVSRE